MEEQAKKPEVMHSFKAKKATVFPKKLALLFFVIVGLGVATGFSLAKYTQDTGNAVPLLPQGGPQKGNVVGSDDTETFKDIAEGVVKEGGIEGEGEYHLERPGGESQNVYMTSSTVDLSEFLGKKVKVWGQTQAAQTAGWLMDVGRVEVL